MRTMCEFQSVAGNRVTSASSSRNVAPHAPKAEMTDAGVDHLGPARGGAVAQAVLVGAEM
jgi:hypothetical protein